MRTGVVMTPSQAGISAIICFYREQFADIKAAISREKELKGWTRAKKEALIATVNPGWEFLTV